MILLLSPSKTQNFSSPVGIKEFSLPDLLKDSKVHIRELKKYKTADLRTLMNISDHLAELNLKRYKKFKPSFTVENAKQALFAFKGHVYVDMDVAHYGKAELAFAQKHLRIVSGLYGFLRPLDLIQPYRLEMSISLPTKKGKDLYQFWNRKITHAANDALLNQHDNILLNLASKEYFKAIHPKIFKGKIISASFKENRKGKYQTIALFAKKARGMMADFVINANYEIAGRSG